MGRGLRTSFGDYVIYFILKTARILSLFENILCLGALIDIIVFAISLLELADI
jgi:hypothetical protein